MKRIVFSLWESGSEARAVRDNWGTVDPVGKGQLEGWCPHNVDRVRVFYESMMKQDLHNGCRHRGISSLLCAVGQEFGNSIQASKRGFTLVASSTLKYCILPSYKVPSVSIGPVVDALSCPNPTILSIP